MSQASPDFIAVFDSLPAPLLDQGLGRFSAQPISGHQVCAIGKDAAGHPVLLIEADNASGSTTTPLVLESLSVIHLVNCRVRLGGVERSLTLSVVRCTSADRLVHEYFLRCLYPIIASLPQRPSREHVTRAIERLVELFRRMADPPRKAAAGLWAELLFISLSNSPQQLLSAWHSIPEERFDFARGQHRIEVKAALGPLRIHHFSLEQLRPTANVVVALVSVLLERSEGGTNIRDLVDSIRVSVTDVELLIRLDNIVASTLGNDWRSAQQICFDVQRATQSLCFFDASIVPSVGVPIPLEVSSVHFRVDLTQLSLDFPSESLERSELFRAAIPDSRIQ